MSFEKLFTYNEFEKSISTNRLWLKSFKFSLYDKPAPWFYRMRDEIMLKNWYELVLQKKMLCRYGVLRNIASFELQLKVESEKSSILTLRTDFLFETRL